MAHFRTSKFLGDKIWQSLSKNSGKQNEPLEVIQDIPWPLGNFSKTYTTSLPEKSKLSQNVKKQIALGIFMDFQILFEYYQGAIDPSCWVIALWHCSSFSNEDLISDYLGFISASKIENISLDVIVNTLGGGYASESPPEGYYPVNYKFTSFRLFEVDECGNINLIRRQLPPSLVPVRPSNPGSGKYWDVPKGHNKIDLNTWM